MRIILDSIIASTGMLDRNDVVVRITITRGTGTFVLMDFFLNARANYRWIAPPGGEMIFDSKPVVTARSEQMPQLRCRVDLASLFFRGPKTHMTILITKKDSPYRDIQNRSD